ncbi:MAG: Fe-S protein assembly co-chaperone HscB [Magnetovibrio sp.]|nr:Fe-S protein assembly co-chaperone HscB [Magnetovibrio sp.]
MDTVKSKMKPCWSCKGPVVGGALFCATCSAVQGPAAVSHFQRLGIKPVFDVNVPQLDQLYFDLQRQLHPDRFATKTSKEKALSQQQATALNDAYETLKDPMRRAAYMVTLQGMDVVEDSSNVVNDQSILIEAMEMRERLDKVQTLSELNPLAQHTKAETDKIIASISAAFEAGDIKTASKLTTRLKYLHKMMGEVRHLRARLMI